MLVGDNTDKGENDITAIRSEKIVFKNGIGYNSKKLFKAAEGLVGIR